MSKFSPLQNDTISDALGKVADDETVFVDLDALKRDDPVRLDRLDFRLDCVVRLLLVFFVMRSLKEINFNL